MPELPEDIATSFDKANSVNLNMVSINTYEIEFNKKNYIQISFETLNTKSSIFNYNTLDI